MRRESDNLNSHNIKNYDYDEQFNFIENNAGITEVDVDLNNQKFYDEFYNYLDINEYNDENVFKKNSFMLLKDRLENMGKFNY